MDKDLFRIYHQESGSGYLAKISAYLPDRPGSLAGLAEIFSKHSINIILFHYDRSVHPNRVILEVTGSAIEAITSIRGELESMNFLNMESTPDSPEIGVLDTRNIVKIEVMLENKPGTLGGFARLLAEHEANVIYMFYNEDISQTSANVSLFTKDPDKVDVLLRDMNSRGYYYSVIYKGAEHREIEDVIGLNLTERFFFKLKKALKTDDISKLRRLIDSSRKLSDALVKFSSEAGKHFQEGGLITSVLAFASASLMKRGETFTYRKLPSMAVDGVTLHAFRLPTGGNIYILENNGAYVMIDGSYGLYYEDVKKMLSENGIDPALIKNIYLTHADADHAGLSGYFREEFGVSVHLHKDSAGIIENDNRAWGSSSPLLDLNHYFTVLVNDFTAASFPGKWTAYRDEESGSGPGLRVIDSFQLGAHNYRVIESLGGHVPGQVFFISYDSGLFFTADYLLLVESLDEGEREILNYPKFMMTSTNVNSSLFRREMEMLKQLAKDLDATMRNAGKEAFIIPGHGDYYSVDRIVV